MDTCYKYLLSPGMNGIVKEMSWSESPGIDHFPTILNMSCRNVMKRKSRQRSFPNILNMSCRNASLTFFLELIAIKCYEYNILSMTFCAELYIFHWVRCTFACFIRLRIRTPNSWLFYRTGLFYSLSKTVAMRAAFNVCAIIFYNGILFSPW